MFQFLSLMDVTVRRYPDCPPYGGRFAETVPHMTVGPCWSPELEAHLRHAPEEVVPISATASEVRLIWNAPKRFDTIATFALRT